MLGCEWDFLKT